MLDNTNKEKMKITVLCSNREHPVYPVIEKWVALQNNVHKVDLVRNSSDLTNGDILFLISASEIISRDRIDAYKKCLVVHASDVPSGRGWSPHVWQIVDGKNEITVSLLEASEKVDRGDIWAQRTLRLEGHELADEINQKLFEIEVELMDFAINKFGKVTPIPQKGEATYYRKRTPEDSRIDPGKPLAEQFNLLRVADNVRFPAFFELRGHRYEIKLEKKDYV